MKSIAGLIPGPVAFALTWKCFTVILTLPLISSMNVFSGSDEELKRMLAEFKEKLQEREIKLAEVGDTVKLI